MQTRKTPNTENFHAVSFDIILFYELKLCSVTGERFFLILVHSTQLIYLAESEIVARV